MKPHENSEVATYKRIGELCAKASVSYRRSCYEGIGNNLPADADFQAANVRAFCEAASQDPLYRLYCKSVAADSLFLGGSGKKGDANGVCAGLTGNEQTYCKAYANDRASAVSQLAVPNTK